MFINFTNHPSAQWSAEQKAAAQAYGEVNPDAVLCQGEFTFVYRVVLRLEREGIPVFAACSFRKSQETISPDGSTLKQSVFVFTRFRRYGSPS